MRNQKAWRDAYVEHVSQVISQYTISTHAVQDVIILHLAHKHTDCLARDFAVFLPQRVVAKGSVRPKAGTIYQTFKGDSLSQVLD